MEKTTQNPTLTAFIDAYITTALWSSSGDDDEPLGHNHPRAHLAPETLAKIVADCAAFIAAHGDTIEAAIETGEVGCGPDFDEWGRAGHDFWLTRCGHGCGFWDGDWPEPMAAQLSEAAHKAGNVDLYLGDDGMIYA